MDSSFSLRPVREKDAPRIAEIYNHYVLHTTSSFETQMVDCREMENRIARFASAWPYFVATDAGGHVVGYCYAHQWKERAAYSHTLETTVYVDHIHRGRGIGTMLMRRLIDTLTADRKTDVKVLIACVTAENEASISMHRRLGFLPVSHFRSVGCKFGRWLDVIDLQYTLE